MRRRRGRATLAVAPLLALLAPLAPLAHVGCRSSESDPSALPDPASRSGFSYRGLNHVSWWHDEYAFAEGTTSRAQLAATGANWAALLVTWYMPARDATAIAPGDLKTPVDDALAQAIRDLHAAGLKVVLKPHVDVLDGTWRGAIRPADDEAWFASYATFIVRYARLAQTSGVEMFCVGTELATMSDARNAARWARLIASVRAVYAGPLIYAANAVAAGDEYTSVAFWDWLDLAGLDAYTPLTNSASPTVDDLVRGWSRNRNGEDMVAAFRNFHDRLAKTVIFTELGYRSADGTNRAPYDADTVSAYDPGEQADCYEAAFRVWSAQSWMRGILWWDWPVPAPAAGDTGYPPRDKPAEAVLSAWQHP